MTDISVIIPAYRAQPFIARAVGSVLAQSRQDFEVVIASDDGCDYLVVLEAQGVSDARVRQVSTNGVGTGVAHARNTALDAARGTIIALLDADDAFYSDKLARMVPLAQEHGFCACVLDYVRHEENGKRLIGRIGDGAPSGMLVPENYLSVHYSANAMMVFDRTRMQGRWREDLPVMEDLAFSMGAFEYLPAVYHLREPLHEYIHTPDSLSTAPQAPARFMAAKRHILQELERGGLGLARKESILAFYRFVKISLQTEEEYGRAMESGESVTFSELLERRLTEWC